MESQIFCGFLKSQLFESQHAQNDAVFSYCRGGFHHIGVQTASLTPYFRMDIIKEAC